MSLDKYDTVDKVLALARAFDVPQERVDYIFESEGFAYSLVKADVPYLLRLSKLVPNFDLDSHRDDMIIMRLKWAIKDAIELRRARRDIAALVNDDGNAETRKWFVTVNFDDVVVTDKVESGVISNFMDRVTSISGLNVISYVPEKFREGGKQIHRHIHMIIESDYKKSKVIQYIFQKNIKVGKEKSLAISKKEFIDVKKWESHHDNYIKGIKRDEKQDCVEMDRVWRAEKGIKSLF